MKKIMISAFAAMALSTVSSAAIITCTAANGNPNVIVNNVTHTRECDGPEREREGEQIFISEN